MLIMLLLSADIAGAIGINAQFEMAKKEGRRTMDEKNNGERWQIAGERPAQALLKFEAFL